MRIRCWLVAGMLLPGLALACPPDEPTRNDNAMLLYASAFKLAEAAGCMRGEGTRQQQCLAAALTDGARGDPDIRDALALIQYGSVRSLRLCDGQEMQEVRLHQGISAALWACHEVSFPARARLPASLGQQRLTLAFAMVEGDPGRVRIGQVLRLLPSSSASREPGEDAVH